MTYRVLIVDDQKEVSRLLKSALETIEQGLIVTEAPSGEEAILEAIRTRVDLLVADFRLPGITGLELVKKFRVFNPDVKIIMISGVSDPRLVKEMQNSGAHAFFAKPVPIGDFLDAVERTLGMARTILHKPEPQPAPPIQSTQTNQPVAPPLVVPLAIEPETPKGLSGVLVNLRKDLNAAAIILIDNMGHIQAEAGQLPDPNSAVSLASSLMGMLNAAQKVASLIDRSGRHLHLFDSDGLDAIFMPLGLTHGLLVTGVGLADAKTLSEKIARLQTAQTDISAALKNMGVQVGEAPTAEQSKQRSAIEEPYTQFENLPRDFMSIFSEMGKKTDSASAFWDTAVEKGTTFAEPDKLTYEQASKLGLTPDNPQKE